MGQAEKSEPHFKVPLALFFWCCKGGLWNLGDRNSGGGAFMLPVSVAVKFVDSSMAGGDGGGKSFESKLDTESFT